MAAGGTLQKIQIDAVCLSATLLRPVYIFTNITRLISLSSSFLTVNFVYINTYIW